MTWPKSISTIAAIISAAFLFSLQPAAASSEGPAITAQEALQKLKDGNLRFVASKHSQTGNNIEAVKKLAGGAEALCNHPHLLRFAGATGAFI